MSTLSIFDAAREGPAELALIDAERASCFEAVAGRVQRHLETLPAFARPASPAAPSGLIAVATDEPSLAIELLLACFERGLPALPLHARWTAAEREAVSSSLPVGWVLETVGGRARCERLAEHSRSSLGASPEAPLVALATSGSTGTPRVALVSRYAFVAAAAASARNLGWRPDDRWLACLPLAHVGGLSVVTRSLLARRPIVLASAGSGDTSSERLASALANGRATIASLVPAQLDGLLELPRFELPSHVRALLVGGAAISRRLLRASADRGWPVLTTYGLTEACSQVATQAPGTVNRGQLGCGRPLEGVQVRLQGGVIEIAGPTLFSGYLGVTLEAAVDGEGWFRTSDAGFFDPEGQLHVAGRVDDIIISGGENVAPWEVEAVLESHPGVLEACVFGVDDARFGQIVAAGLRVDHEPSDFVAGLDRACRQSLAAHKRPRLYACVREFARGPNGKPARRIIASELRSVLRPAPASS